MSPAQTQLTTNLPTKLPTKMPTTSSIKPTELSVHDLVCLYSQGRINNKFSSSQAVVDGLSFQLKPGEIGCLLGASGCGKTTTLRAIAGLHPVTSGHIAVDEKIIADSQSSLAPEKRGFGMVFQEYALFPHMTVSKNIGFGLKLKRHERATRIAELVKLTGLEGCEDRYPEALSGGQQQRVALARALAPRPKLLLLDEPFSNLDVELRERLSNEVHDILKAEGVTALLVTHEQLEAFAMADKLGVMHKGKIVQWDTPYNIYHEPATRYVADFIGQGRFIRGQVTTATEVATSIGNLTSRDSITAPAGSNVDVLLRPDDVIFDPTGPLAATVVKRAFKGAEILYTLKLETGDEVLSLFHSHENFDEGANVRVRTNAEHVIAFPA